MNKFIYEIMYILCLDMIEEKVEQVIIKYKSMLEEQGVYDIKI